MTLTISNWLFFGAIIIIGFGISGFMFYAAYENGNKLTTGFINMGIVIVLAVAYLLGVSWYHNNTAKGVRT